MIERKSGNMMDSGAEALVNTVNCVGVMGKGVALQMKQAFPDNFTQYERACRAGDMQPGRVLSIPTALDRPRYILNFPTKRHWREKSRLEDIDSGLQSLVQEVMRLGIRTIAIPPLGCGNEGLDWADVAPRIEKAFADLPSVRVMVYEPMGSPASAAMSVATDRPKMTRARALVVSLIDSYRIPGYRLTLLEIQKLAYFLQVAGEPLRLQYVKHKYGPYAENLHHAL